MYPTFLLLVGCILAFSASVISARTNTDTYDSLLLQKENWPGFGLLSIAFAMAAFYRFLQFVRVYELDQNHHFGLDYFGVDWNQPIPLIYGTFTVVVACYVVWRRKSKSALHNEKRRLQKEAVVLTLLIGLVTFGCFVWPTPWTYETMSQSMIDGERGTLPGPLEYRGQPVTYFRRNRFTNENEAKMGIGGSICTTGCEWRNYRFT